MQEAGRTILGSWQNFFMITGTAAATLTGLMFIVITLIAGIDVHIPTINAALSAFNTPTLVHFCSVLLLALILSAPWQAFAGVSVVLVVLSVLAVLYLIGVIGRMRRIPGYQTPLRDWLWYSALPFGAYAALAVSALALLANPALAVDGIAAIMIALLFIGIRNAWDLLTFLAIDRAHSANPRPDEE